MIEMDQEIQRAWTRHQFDPDRFTSESVKEKCRRILEEVRLEEERERKLRERRRDLDVEIREIQDRYLHHYPYHDLVRRRTQAAAEGTEAKGEAQEPEAADDKSGPSIVFAESLLLLAHPNDKLISMADDDWTYRRRRIPITKGWGPCKRTYWVPVDEHYRGNDGRRTRTLSRTIGLDPDALPERRRGGVYYLDDDYEPRDYAGFREIMHDDRAGRDERVQQRYPDEGWNAVWPWQPPIPWDALDPAIAEDLQQLENMRAQQHQERMDRQNQEINEIDGRAVQHIQGMQENQQEGGDEGRLQRLRAEMAADDENRRRRREEDDRREHRMERARREQYHWEQERDRDRERRARRRGRPQGRWGRLDRW
ncbi:hypothetical protein A1O1_06234 [Capronia coronata CBS 617.96]|uniref:Uncharacterized protein n=1 Tax=Capronia coronata CBS 617.96 TaxID=1182541 RepID=W9Y8D5_9EURO|nr:uncharacterized protein A1O1_06234 [Capronia coronata CBS 617.96]EXJ85865.1 hypothetical protein A1O1_06234 [Capronia coronata CBS 617.96]